MRVPDSAMGTLGRCPKCETSLRVPTVPIPADVHAAPRAGRQTAVVTNYDPAAETSVLPQVVTPAASAGFPFSDPEEAQDAGPSQVRGGLFPIADDEPAVAVVDPIVASRSRRKRGQSRGWLWLTLAFVAAAVGIAAAFYFQQTSNPVYAVEGELLSEASLSTVLSQKDFPLSDPDWLAIRKGLEQSPAELRSPQMNITFESAPRGLKVGLKPGRHTELVAVPVQTVAPLAAASGPSGQPLQEPHRQAVVAALGEMSRQMQRSTAAGQPVELSSFGGSVGVTGLGGPLGYVCHAVIDRSAYPCVFEDREHRLYFLVPSGTGEFFIRLKHSSGVAGVLPSRLQVRVNVRRGEVVRSDSNEGPAVRNGSKRGESSTEPRDADRSAGPDRAGDVEPPPAD